MQRQQAFGTEFSASDPEGAGVEVEVCHPQSKQLANAHSSAGREPEHGDVSLRPK